MSQVISWVVRLKITQLTSQRDVFICLAGRRNQIIIIENQTIVTADFQIMI